MANDTDARGSEGALHGKDLLASKKSLEDILRVATAFEKTARDFYSALVPRVSKQLRYLVEELAEEEQRHYDLFMQLAGAPDLQQQVRAQVAVPVNDRRFSDYVQAPELGDNPDDQAVLQYALGREHAAMEQYRDLAANTEPGPIHDLFEFLANEETKHKRELEQLYYRVVHSGGV
ncbi:MAG: ferritin family protein [Pseudomonadota bacterium]